MKQKYYTILQQFDESNMMKKFNFIEQLDDDQLIKSNLLDETSYHRKRKRINTKINYE
jgi:hypothetical protein